MILEAPKVAAIFCSSCVWRIMNEQIRVLLRLKFGIYLYRAMVVSYMEGIACCCANRLGKFKELLALYSLNSVSRASLPKLFLFVLLIVSTIPTTSRFQNQDTSFFSVHIQVSDRELVHQLQSKLHHRRRHMSCNFTWQPLMDSEYVDSIISTKLPYGGKDIVTKARKRTTAWLTRASLVVPVGDIVETGTYFGTSAAIILRVMKDFDFCHRKLWVFDSFEGLPMPSKEDRWQGTFGKFNATEDTFKRNMMAAGVYDEARLVVTKGWFRDTCPQSKVEKIAFLRLDGDLFASTWDAITALYAKVVPGGIVYVDDYGSFMGCRQAIDLFREQLGIYETLHYVRENSGTKGRGRKIEFEAVWWVKRTN